MSQTECSPINDDKNNLATLSTFQHGSESDFENSADLAPFRALKQSPPKKNVQFTKNVSTIVSKVDTSQACPSTETTDDSEKRMKMTRSSVSSLTIDFDNTNSPTRSNTNNNNNHNTNDKNTHDSINQLTLKQCKTILSNIANSNPRLIQKQL